MKVAFVAIIFGLVEIFYLSCIKAVFNKTYTTKPELTHQFFGFFRVPSSSISSSYHSDVYTSGASDSVDEHVHVAYVYLILLKVLLCFARTHNSAAQPMNQYTKIGVYAQRGTQLPASIRTSAG